MKGSECVCTMTHAISSRILTSKDRVQYLIFPFGECDEQCSNGTGLSACNLPMKGSECGCTMTHAISSRILTSKDWDQSLIFLFGECVGQCSNVTGLSACNLDVNC